MGRIRILDDLLVNKIAAGEVVERPASVVKELLENALDAGAKRIRLDVEDGGKRLMRVVDDGMGMDADDLTLAVTPHATSKLAREEDLYQIATLGFRGEALASIGSVSELRMTSRRSNSDEAHTLVVTGGKIDGPHVTGASAGTTIEVRNLFYNVPARAKFLRTASTEMGHIGEQVTRIGLGSHNVDLTVTHNGRETHRVPADDDPRVRIGALFSDELADDLIPLACDQRGLRIEGLLAPPNRARASGRWQYVLLNGRYIRDRFIQHAITEAHRGLLDGNNSPVLFLFMTVDPHMVDVNVHPTKIEVRWRDSGLIHSQVLSVLRDALLSRDLTGRLKVAEPSPEPSETQKDALRREMASQFLQTPMTSPPQAEPQPARTTASLPSFAAPASGETAAPRSDGWPSDGGASARHAELYRSVEARAQPASEDSGKQPADRPEQNHEAIALRTRVMQLHNAYLVAETDDGLMIVDQHALHERVLYNELRDRLTRGPLESQRLLLPETVEATEAQMSRLEAHGELLTQLGFDVSPFGRTTVAVHAVPSLLPDSAVNDFFVSLLDQLVELPTTTEAEELLHTVLDMMACKAAVKAGDPLNEAEIQSLLAKADGAEKASNCPHGRPTTLRMSVHDLEKQFHRT